MYSAISVWLVKKLRVSASMLASITCVVVCVHVSTCVCMCACVSMHVFCVWVGMCVCECTDVLECAACACVWACACACACVRMTVIATATAETRQESVSREYFRRGGGILAHFSNINFVNFPHLQVHNHDLCVWWVACNKQINRDTYIRKCIHAHTRKCKHAIYTGHRFRLVLHSHTHTPWHTRTHAHAHAHLNEERSVCFAKPCRA